jgi:hypothetical protein
MTMFYSSGNRREDHQLLLFLAQTSLQTYPSLIRNIIMKNVTTLIFVDCKWFFRHKKLQLQLTTPIVHLLNTWCVLSTASSSHVYCLIKQPLGTGASAPHPFLCPHWLYGSACPVTSGMLARPSVFGGLCAESRKWLSATFPGHYLPSEWRQGTGQWRITNVFSELILLSKNGQHFFVSETLSYADFWWQMLLMYFVRIPYWTRNYLSKQVKGWL